MEKHVVENEPVPSEESGSDTRAAPPSHVTPVLRDSNHRKDFKVTQVLPQVTVPIKMVIGDSTNRKDLSASKSLSKSTPDIHAAAFQTTVTSFNVTPSSQVQGQQQVRVKQMQRSGSSGTPPLVGAGKENIQPQLTKAKTFDSGKKLRLFPMYLLRAIQLQTPSSSITFKQGTDHCSLSFRCVLDFRHCNPGSRTAINHEGETGQGIHGRKRT